MPLQSLRNRLYGANREVHYHNVMWHAGKWDAPLYAAFVAVGVPFMGYVSPGQSYGKLVVTLIWFALSTLYWWIELKEIDVEIKKNGLLNITERTHQKLSMQLLYWGVTVAVVVWALSWARGYSGPSYGWIEWGILAHTLVVAWMSIGAIYPLIDNYLQASAGQRRVEEETVTRP